MQPTVISATMLLLTLGVIFATIMLHYETIYLLGKSLGRSRGIAQRPRFVFMILGLLTAHAAEIVLFAATAWAASYFFGLGGMYQHGFPEPATFLDYLYLSASSYTTVGYGDLAPTGYVRLIYASESLMGLVLITWSASYTYLEMERHWRD